ncbi:MAG: hypothetical protein R3212_07000, partial [Xanthomonadales bacterium]|nr:hypothetical protein [Xanthomonadales bacterium]
MDVKAALACLLTVWLCACAATTDSGAAEVVAQAGGAPAESGAPSDDAPTDGTAEGEAENPEEGQAAGTEQTDEEVMYNVFAAELLGSEGDLEGAVKAYLEAAMESDDPAIARRAT